MDLSGLGRAVAETSARNSRPEVQASRAEARVLKAQRERELELLQSAPLTEQDKQNYRDAQSLQLDLATRQLKEMQNKAIKQNLYSAFDRYLADYSPRHFNTMLKEAKSTEMGAELFGDTARMDAISDSDRDLISRAGLDPDLILGSPEMRSEFLKVTGTDGEVEITSVGGLAQMTGYMDYASDKELDRQMTLAKIAKMKRESSGVGSSVVERQAALEVQQMGYQQGSPEFTSAYTKRLGELRAKSGNGSTIERQAQREALVEGLTQGTPEYDRFVTERVANYMTPKARGSSQEREADRIVKEMGLEEGTPEYAQEYNATYAAIVERDARTSTTKNMEAADKATDTLEELAKNDMNGHGDFFDIDFAKANHRQRARYERHIARVEEQSGATLSEADKKELMSINQLISVADPVADITDAQTGLIDSLANTVKKYISDNTSGTEATAAYNAYRNTLLRAFAGAAMSTGELKRFQSEMGSLGQQTGPVLAQFVNNLRQVRSRLESISATNNPYVVHYRAGVSMDELNTVIWRIDERIDMLNSLAKTPGSGGLTPEVEQALDAQYTENPETPVSLTPERIQELDSIYSGAQQ